MSELHMLKANKAKSIPGCIRRSVATQRRALSSPLAQHWYNHIWTSVSACGAPQWGGTKNVLEEIYQEGVLGICREAEGPGFLWPHELEADGTKVAACDSLKDYFRDDGAFLGSEKERKSS